MPKHGKKYRESREKIDRMKKYPLLEALELTQQLSWTKFDEMLEVAFRLGVNPKHADQMVRGAVVLPHGTGKQVRVLVFAKGDKEKEAKDAGADFVGAEDMVKKVQDGWLEFDKAIATPDVMGMVGKLGKILGPRGMMPNPKVGTVTFEVDKAVADLKAGKVEFKVDKAGNLHVPIGKLSIGTEKLKENFLTLLDTVVRAKPAASKGVYLRNISLSSSMGVGIKVDPQEAQSTISRG